MISFIFQTGTESFLFTTNKVYDSMEKEQARLYYPFTLSVTKSKLRYVYPFFYETVSLIFEFILRFNINKTNYAAQLYQFLGILLSVGEKTIFNWPS